MPRTGGARVACALVLAAALTAGACGRRGSSSQSLRGTRLEVVAVWSGTEAQHFEEVLRAFERQTGATVQYTSARHRIADYLSERLDNGDPPDVAFVPQPGLLREYAHRGRIVPLAPAAAAVVRRNYPLVWRQLGSVDGRQYAVWFKAADKSLIWYNIAAFEQAGVVPPSRLDQLAPAAARIAARGTVPFSVGGADGWTLTDWFENLYLDLAGPERYEQLAEHRLAWTDESVKRTLSYLSELLAPDRVVGGSEGALQTTYEMSVDQTFSRQPAAAMVFEGDFVAGVISADTRAELGIDADVFPFPTLTGRASAVVGGGDAAVLLRRSRAGDALMAYLATPAAAAVWARQGGFLSPNLNLDLSEYADTTTRSIARSLLEAGDAFRFDLSDLQPASFGASPNSGMRKILQSFLRSRDVEATAIALEQAASAAYSP